MKGSPEVVVDLPGIARVRAKGPSGSIAEIRVERENAANKLKTLTDVFGTTDLETLDALQDKATQLDERIAAAQVQIDTLLAEEPLEKIEVERATCAAMVAGIVADYPDWHEAAPRRRGARGRGGHEQASLSRCFGTRPKRLVTPLRLLSTRRANSGAWFKCALKWPVRVRDH